MSAFCCNIERDILSRLPIKSLLRFMSVCKRWPIFIDDVLAKKVTLGANSRILLCPWRLQDMVKGIASPQSIDYEGLIKSRDDEGAITQVSIPTTENICDSLMKVVGSCNGLVCLLIRRRPPGTNDIVLWNPLTENYKTLPHPSVSNESDAFPLDKRVACGFGYDSSSGDYKVIARDTYGSHHVYSLKTDTWATLDSDAVPVRFMRFRLYCPDTMTLSNGALHWYMHGGSARRDVVWSDGILAFDLAEEKFRDVPLPDFIHSWHPMTHAHELLDLDGRLCFYNRRHLSNYGPNIWVMKEYGVKESWMPWIRVADMPGFQPLGMSQNKEIVALIDCGDMKKMVTYDPIRETYQVIKPYKYTFYYGVVYEQSLVSPTVTSPTIGGFLQESSP